MGGGSSKEIKLTIDPEMEKALNGIRKKRIAEWTPIQLQIIHEDIKKYNFKGLCKLFGRDPTTVRIVQKTLEIKKQNKKSDLAVIDYIELAEELNA